MKAVWAVALLLIPLLAHTGSAAEVTEGPAPLYLLPGGDDDKNLTLAAPNATQPVLDAPNQVTGTHLYWAWRLPRSPEDWSIAVGDEIVATLYFEGLDRVVPLNNRYGPEQVGKLRINVDIFTNGGLYTGAGSLDEPLQESFSNATGEVLIDPPFLSGEGDVKVVVPLEVPRASLVAAQVEFAIRVAVSGLAPADARPNMRLASESTPSHIIIEGYPVDAFRDWESASVEERRCNELILRGESCIPVEPPAEIDDEVAPAPGPPLLVVLVFLSLFGWVQRQPRASSKEAPRKSCSVPGP